MARLLVCRRCGTMNRMRDYEGNPEYDFELQEVIQAHMQRSPYPPHPEEHPATLFRVSDEEAELLDVESEVVKALSDEQIFIKEVRDDMKVEALKCYTRHNRPKDNCVDYKDESKTIGRKIGVPKEHRKYLCEFCPIESKVMFKKRKKAGLYDK